MAIGLATTPTGIGTYTGARYVANNKYDVCFPMAADIDSLKYAVASEYIFSESKWQICNIGTRNIVKLMSGSRTVAIGRVEHIEFAYAKASSADNSSFIHIV